MLREEKLQLHVVHVILQQKEAQLEKVSPLLCLIEDLLLGVTAKSDQKPRCPWTQKMRTKLHMIALVSGRMREIEQPEPQHFQGWGRLKVSPLGSVQGQESLRVTRASPSRSRKPTSR